MRKIVIHANVIWTIVNFRKNLIKFLLENDYEVICIADYDDLSGISMNVLNELNVKFIQVSIARASINPLKDLIYMSNLYKVYSREKPDIILSYTIKPNIFGNFVASLLNIPVISTINGLGSGMISENFISTISKKLYSFSLRKTKKVFFQNDDDQTFFISNNLVKESKCDYVPGSGINYKDYENCEKQNNKQLTFILIARLINDKGIIEYIEAIKLLKESGNKSLFLLAGSFDEVNPSAISKNDVQIWEDDNLITFLGKTDNICDFLKLSDVVVLPSYREGLSRLLLEAASARKVIVTTDVPGCRDVVKNGFNGYLCKVQDSDDLKNKMEKVILLSASERIKMGENGQKKVIEEFDESIVFLKYLETIEEILL